VAVAPRPPWYVAVAPASLEAPPSLLPRETLMAKSTLRSIPPLTNLKFSQGQLKGVIVPHGQVFAPPASGKCIMLLPQLHLQRLREGGRHNVRPWQST